MTAPAHPDRVDLSDLAEAEAAARDRSQVPVPPRAGTQPRLTRRWPGNAQPLARVGQSAALPGQGGPAPAAMVDVGALLDLSLASASSTQPWLRRVPSAGALHPVEVYLHVGAGCGLSPGRYAYDPIQHAVIPLSPAEGAAHSGTQDDADFAGVLLVVAAAPHRTVWKYGARSLPSILLDAGHAMAAITAAATTLNHVAHASLAHPMELLSAATGLPSPATWVRHWPGRPVSLPLAAVWLPARHGAAPPQLTPAPLSAAPAPETVHSGDDVSVRAMIERALRAAASAPGAPHGWFPLSVPRLTGAELLARRSTVGPLSGPLPPGLHHELLRAAHACLSSAPVQSAGHDARGKPTTATGIVLAADADDERSACLVGLDGQNRVVVVGRGDARPTLASWAFDQHHLATAGAVLTVHADLRRITGDYLRSHLLAGAAVHAAHLAAIAAGAPSRPIGSWDVQADLGRALGHPEHAQMIVHGLAVGAAVEKEATC